MGIDFNGDPEMSKAQFVLNHVINGRKHEIKDDHVWTVDASGITAHYLEYNFTDGWGVKEISEAEEPTHLDCPVDFFDDSPITGRSRMDKSARDWRKKVKAEWAKTIIT